MEKPTFVAQNLSSALEMEAESAEPKEQLEETETTLDRPTFLPPGLSIANAKRNIYWAVENMLDANHVHYCARHSFKEINQASFSLSTMLTGFEKGKRRPVTFSPQHNSGFLRGKLLVEWLEVMGAGIARHCYPTKLEGRVLTLTCSSPIWSSEILLQQRNILKKLNRVLSARGKTTVVSRLYCVVGSVQDNNSRQTLIGNLLCNSQGEIIADPRYSHNPDSLINYEANKSCHCINSGITLSAETQNRYAQIAQLVKDDRLRERLKHIMCQAALNKQEAISQGAKVCSKCQGLYWDEGCLKCEREAQEAQIRQIYNILDNYPWLSHEQVEQLIDNPPLSLDTYWKVKKEFALKQRYQAWAIMRSLKAGAPLPLELRSLLISLASLNTRVPIEKISEGDIKRGLRPVLANAYLKDCAVDCAAYVPNATKP